MIMNMCSFQGDLSSFSEPLLVSKIAWKGFSEGRSSEHFCLVLGPSSFSDFDLGRCGSSTWLRLVSGERYIA